MVCRCCTCEENGVKKYNASTIRESDLRDAVVKAIQEVLGGNDVFLSVLDIEYYGEMESERGDRWDSQTVVAAVGCFDTWCEEGW